MDTIKFISDEREQELEEELEKEIYNLKNKIICERKFIYLISKKYSFLEFCYLYSTYIAPKEEKIIALDLRTLAISTEYKEPDKENANKNPYPIKCVKRVKRIERMANMRKSINYTIKRR